MMRGLVILVVFFMYHEKWLSVHGKTQSKFVCANKIRQILNQKGGASQQSMLDEKSLEEEQQDYYESFHLDYGSKDTSRKPGFLRGFIKAGSLASLPEKDAFLKWMNEYVENGDKSIKGRIKPFYGTDFGTKKDLKKGENPKLIIVQRKLATDENNVLLKPDEEIDVEIREIWQPWLKRKCNFVVRYIVPNRQNIIRILAARNQFHAELKYDEDEKGKKSSWIKLKFKPSLWDRLRGKKDVIIKNYVNAEKLFPKRK